MHPLKSSMNPSHATESQLSQPRARNLPMAVPARTVQPICILPLKPELHDLPVAFQARAMRPQSPRPARRLPLTLRVMGPLLPLALEPPFPLLLPSLTLLRCMPCALHTPLRMSGLRLLLALLLQLLLLVCLRRLLRLLRVCSSRGAQDRLQALLLASRSLLLLLRVVVAAAPAAPRCVPLHLSDELG